MLKTPIARGVALATLGATLAIPTMAQAAFIDDTKAGLELRNFYFNRDFREDAGQNKRDEWAQGFLLRVQSGYTEGTVGFGVDALGLLGVKLDSGGGSGGSELLPADRSGGPFASQDDYSELGAAAKVKLSNTVLKYGSMQLKNPAVASSDGRLLPQVFKGVHVTSQEVDGLFLEAGQMNRFNHRHSSNYEKIGLNGAGATKADDFIFAGGSYKVLDNLTAGYYYSKLEDIYKQNSFNLVHVLPLGDKQSLKTDVRYAINKDDGSAEAGDRDNKAFGAMVTYALSGHSFGLGYQKMSGDTGFSYVDGTDPYLVNFVQIGNFASKDEKSWQARYDFNFASVGVPGLTFMTRYLTGDNIDRGANASEGKEWERDTDIGYVFQDGTLKDLGIKWRNATVRNNTGRDVDENRLIVSYTIPLM